MEASSLAALRENLVSLNNTAQPAQRPCCMAAEAAAVGDICARARPHTLANIERPCRQELKASEPQRPDRLWRGTNNPLPLAAGPCPTPLSSTSVYPEPPRAKAGPSSMTQPLLLRPTRWWPTTLTPRLCGHKYLARQDPESSWKSGILLLSCDTRRFFNEKQSFIVSHAAGPGSAELRRSLPAFGSRGRILTPIVALGEQLYTTG